MTQIISYINTDYVLLLADRRLTQVGGPRHGSVIDDETCKLVALCSTWVIGYTGYAQLEGTPTHEWIGKRLAERNCADAWDAAVILTERSQEAMRGRYPLELTFVIAGWAPTAAGPIAEKFLISNMWTLDRQRRSTPSRVFTMIRAALIRPFRAIGNVWGAGMSKVRSNEVARLLRTMRRKKIGPHTVCGFLAKEIAKSPHKSVGTKVLACCIPRNAASHFFRTGQALMFTGGPSVDYSTYMYIDPQQGDYTHFGPTTVCGQLAVTDVKAVIEPGGAQSSSVKILHLPPPASGA